MGRLWNGSIRSLRFGGTFSFSGKREMSDLIQRFKIYLETEQNASGHTIRAYLKDLHSVRQFACDRLGQNVRVERLDTDLLKSYLAKRIRERQKSTVARELTAIKSFFKFLVREGILAVNPAQNIPTPKLSKPLPQVLSIDEVLDLLKMPDVTPLGLRNRAILELLYSSGLRVSELVGLNMQDIRWELGVTRVWGKGGRERIVPIGEAALDALKIYIGRRKQPCRKSNTRGGGAVLEHPRGQTDRQERGPHAGSLY